MKTQEYNPSKLKSLFHYVIKAAGTRPGFGATKLYKVAWFSDAKTFLLKGHSITGETYVRREHGPVPYHGEKVRADLAAIGAISQRKGATEFEGWHFRSLSSPDLSMFSEQEMQTINYWIKEIDQNHTAQSISDVSHDYGWEIASMYERLPMHAFLAARVREPNDQEFSAIQERARRLGIV